MTTSVTTRLVIGVDDSAGSMAALRWAAPMAETYHCPITLVHVYPDLRHRPARAFRVPEQTLRSESMQILRRAEERLRSSGFTGEEPALVARAGSPVDVLTEASDGQRMLVLGRRGGSGFVRSLLGSTAYGAAEHATVPAAVVPDGWDAAAHAGGDIVLGLDGDATGDAAAAYAFELASRTGSPLHGVHVCQPFDPYLPVQVFVGEDREWLEAEERCLVEQLAGWAEKYPDVQVRRDVLGGHEVGVLLGLAAHARAVVVGGRSRGSLYGALIGSVGRGLMHHAECPVILVHKGT